MQNGKRVEEQIETSSSRLVLQGDSALRCVVLSCLGLDKLEFLRGFRKMDNIRLYHIFRTFRAGSGNSAILSHDPGDDFDTEI